MIPPHMEIDHATSGQRRGEETTSAYTASTLLGGVDRLSFCSRGGGGFLGFGFRRQTAQPYTLIQESLLRCLLLLVLPLPPPPPPPLLLLLLL